MTPHDEVEKKFPLLRCVQQEIKAPKLLNIKNHLIKLLNEYDLASYINQGESVALTASSRGIKDQSEILKIIADYIKDLNAKPFIFPAMGSHGGGTVEGQLKILEDFGITHDKIGCPVIASMEVIEIGNSEFGQPIYLDKHASEADKIILLNKIKTHSKFNGVVESGLSKMCVIGLGKHKGAKLYHQLIDEHSWSDVIKSMRERIVKKVPIACGIGIIENINNETAEIQILHPDEFESKEPELLQKYKLLNEYLPFYDIDLMIVDEMGKNIFGTGMDTNITGRKPGSSIKVQWLFVRDLTEETHGNAQGIGLADFTTKKLVDKIDYSKMYENALTAFRTDSPKIPIYLENDKEVLKTLLNLSDLRDPKKLKVIWIKNTLKLHKIILSESLFDIVESKEELSFISDTEQISFDSDGFLINSKKYW